MPALILDATWEQSRGAGRDDDIRSRHLVDVRQQGALQALDLRSALLHEAGVGNRTRQVAGETKPLLRRPLREANSLERRPRIRDRLAKPLLALGSGIPGNDVETTGERSRRPATADHARSDNRQLAV